MPDWDEPDFDGQTYEPARDHTRLTTQLVDVLALMRDGQWRTLRHMSQLLIAPEASISARLRDLRKVKFGGYQVERRYLAHGLHEYRVLPPAPDANGRLF
jgi:hypothetical protein